MLFQMVWTCYAGWERARKVFYVCFWNIHPICGVKGNSTGLASIWRKMSVSPPVLFYTGKVCIHCICLDYKSLPRHRGFWENLESERERERKRSSSDFEWDIVKWWNSWETSGRTELHTHTHIHRCILRLRNTHGNTLCLLHRSEVARIVIFFFFFSFFSSLFHSSPSVSCFFCVLCFVYSFYSYIFIIVFFHFLSYFVKLVF